MVCAHSKLLKSVVIFFMPNMLKRTFSCLEKAEKSFYANGFFLNSLKFKRCELLRISFFKLMDFEAFCHTFMRM